MRPLAVEDMHEARLAHDAAGDHAPGDGDLLAFQPGKVREDVRAGVRNGVGCVAEGIVPLLLEGGELVPPNLQKLAELLLRKLLFGCLLGGLIVCGLFHSGFSSKRMITRVVHSLISVPAAFGMDGARRVPPRRAVEKKRGLAAPPCCLSALLADCGYLELKQPAGG